MRLRQGEWAQTTQNTLFGSVFLIIASPYPLCTVADNQSPLIFLMNFFDDDYTQDRFQMSKYSSLDVKDKICTSQFSKIQKIRF